MSIGPFSSIGNIVTRYLYLCMWMIVITGSDDGLVKELIGKHGNEFALRELGELQFFLGIQVKKIQQGLHLTQQQYLCYLLKSCNMKNLKQSSTPMGDQRDLYEPGEIIDEHHEYRRIVGSLLYLTLIRPDIQFVVNKLSQFIEH